MTKRLGVVMDPIDAINIKKDSTFAMLLEASRRNYELVYLPPGSLFADGSQARGMGRALTVRDDADDWFGLDAPDALALGELDVILMRKDPPFNMEYIYATYLLELAGQQGALIVNDPQALRDCNEKMATLWFPELAPPTLVTSGAALIRDFLGHHRDVIIKPLDGMGGASIFRLREGDPNTGVVIETLTGHGKRLAMVQRFIPEISEGDKRILLIDGEPVPYTLARIPAQGETRGNLAAGGKGVPMPLTGRERAICDAVASKLTEKGLIFVGLDVIGDYITEINVTSPTCIRELDAAYNINIAGMLFDAIERRLEHD